MTAAVRNYLNRKTPAAARTINLRPSHGAITDDRALADAARQHVTVHVTLETAEPHGALIHWASGYDQLVRKAFAGHESLVRAQLLDTLALRDGHRPRSRLRHGPLSTALSGRRSFTSAAEAPGQKTARNPPLSGLTASAHGYDDPTKEVIAV